MSIQSLVWIAWAAGGVLGHWITPARWRDWFLVIFTMLFLAVNSPVSALLLTSLTVATFVVTKRQPVGGTSVAMLAIVIVGMLAAYKISMGELSFDAGAELLIPLGLSYYTLRCLHYAIERYKGTIKDHSFADFISYQFFFPTLVAGPIHRFTEFDRDRQRRRWDPQQFSAGLERILFGFTKVVVLGNFLISQVLGDFVANRLAIDGSALGASDPSLPWFVYLDLLRHGLNLYFQFSGYSDVAIGVGLLLGFRVMENFNWPFLKKNVSEFWQSWHISLTSWCREYIYMGVISNWRSPALAATATMLAIGFWHEISLRYLVWGIYHACGIAVWQRFQRIKPRLPNVNRIVPATVLTGLSIALTFHFIILGFSIVQGPTLAVAVQKWRILFFS